MQVCCVFRADDRWVRKSRRLCEESEETGGGGREEAELDGESTSGGVLDVGVLAVLSARAGRLGAGGRCGHGA